MPQFELKMFGTNKCPEEIARCARVINKETNAISDVRKMLDIGTATDVLDGKLEQQQIELRFKIKKLKNLSNALSDILNTYRITEDEILAKESPETSLFENLAPAQDPNLVLEILKGLVYQDHYDGPYQDEMYWMNFILSLIPVLNVPYDIIKLGWDAFDLSDKIVNGTVDKSYLELFYELLFDVAGLGLDIVAAGEYIKVLKEAGKATKAAKIAKKAGKGSKKALKEAEKEMAEHADDYSKVKKARADKVNSKTKWKKTNKSKKKNPNKTNKTNAKKSHETYDARNKKYNEITKEQKEGADAYKKAQSKHRDASKTQEKVNDAKKTRNKAYKEVAKKTPKEIVGNFVVTQKPKKFVDRVNVVRVVNNDCDIWIEHSDRHKNKTNNKK